MTPLIKLAINTFFGIKFVIYGGFTKAYFDKNVIFHCCGQNNNYFCGIMLPVYIYF